MITLFCLDLTVFMCLSQLQSFVFHELKDCYVVGKVKYTVFITKQVYDIRHEYYSRYLLVR